MDWAALGVKNFSFDTDGGFYEVVFDDGRTVREAAPKLGAEFPQDFSRSTYNCADRTVTLVPPVGDPLVLEVFDGGDMQARRAGRPVVYLDQNQWIHLGRSVHAPERLTAPELVAARELIRLAETRQVILPVSSGHLIETAQTDGQWRTRLAPLMASLSWGWVMRDPLRVRADELRHVFSQRVDGPIHPVGDVFTLDTSQVTAVPDAEPPPSRPPSGLPDGADDLVAATAGATAIMAVLLEDERVHSTDGAEKAAAWARHHQDYGKWLKAANVAPGDMRRETMVVFLSDLKMDVAVAARDARVPLTEFEGWGVDHADRDIATLPYLGRYRDVIHLRLSNAQDRWKQNDLIDMLYLPCAAGYADYVVAENKTVDYLHRVERNRTGGAVTVASLTALLEALP